MMNNQNHLQCTIRLTLAVLLLAGCSGVLAPPTPTPIPPTPTPSTGKVVGEITLTPTSAQITATVTLTGTTILTTTLDAQRRYAFTDVKPGDYSIDIVAYITPCNARGAAMFFNSDKASGTEWSGIVLPLQDGNGIVMLTIKNFRIAIGEVKTKNVAVSSCSRS